MCPVQDIKYIKAAACAFDILKFVIDRWIIITCIMFNKFVTFDHPQLHEFAKRLCENLSFAVEHKENENVKQLYVCK